jgi:flagella basal body P-ring formation protein FlgA
MAKMKQNLINMNVVNVRGPETIEVRADGTLMTGEKLAQLTQEYVLKETGWSEDETRFEVSKYPRDISLPPGKLDVEIWKVSGDFYGITHFRTDIRVDERSIRSVPLVIHIQRFVPVMVPTRDLAAGEELLPGDVTVKQYDLSRESIRVRTGFCRPETPIVGKRVERYCQAGRVLTYEMLLDPPIVERGERVVIETTKGGVYVTSPGEARSSAAVGEKVPVKSLLSGKIIMARVVRPGTVTVD